MNINPNSLINAVFPKGHRWPLSFPTFTWNGLRLAGPADNEVLDRSQTSLSTVWRDCHPRMGLGALARWARWHKDNHEWAHAQKVNFDDIFQIYFPRARSDDREYLEALCCTTEEFLDWVEDKDLALKELSFFRWSDTARLVPADFWTQFVAASPTRSIGTQALELYFELLELGLSPAPLANFNLQADRWLEALRLQRFPDTTVEDRRRQELIKSLPWPRFVRAEWIREGDQSFAEVQIRVFSKDDFSGKLQSLQHVLLHLNDL